MNIQENGIVIRPSFIKTAILLAALRMLIDPIVHAGLDKCHALNECIVGTVVENRISIVLFAIIIGLIFRRMHAVEIGDAISLAANTLKKVGSPRIELSNDFTFSFNGILLTIVQDKNKIRLSTLMYSRSDIDNLISILKNITSRTIRQP